VLFVASLSLHHSFRYVWSINVVVVGDSSLLIVLHCIVRRHTHRRTVSVAIHRIKYLITV